MGHSAGAEAAVSPGLTGQVSPGQVTPQLLGVLWGPCQGSGQQTLRFTSCHTPGTATRQS